MEWLPVSHSLQKGVLRMGKKRIRFIGDFYDGYDPVTKRDVTITKKGIVTVSEEKAKQLLADFPKKFKELSWRPKKEEVEEEKVEKLEEKKLEPLKDKKLEELKNK